jgi:hypothetical protein
MKNLSKLLGGVIAFICIAVGFIFIFWLEFEVSLTEVAIGSAFILLGIGIAVLFFLEQSPSKLLAVVFAGFYIAVGVGFIFVPPFLKADFSVEAGIGFTLLGLGITVSLYVGQMESTANFYFDDKKKILMEYNQKISKIGSNNSSDDLGYVLDQVECDLIALSDFSVWASKDKKEDLVSNQIMKIIHNAQSKDTCNNNKKRRCRIIRVSLEIAPNHKELTELEKAENCAKLLMKGK